MVVVRYAVDFVLGFQHRQEAERFLRDLGQRLKQFGLSLHPDKTRLIEFGRFAARNRKERGERKPETFDFLGFTHMVATSKDGNWFFVRRKTVTKRLRAKLKELRGQLLRRRHEGIRRVGKWLGSVVRGYFNYHAIPGNMPALETFRREVCRSWLHALRRRGQHGRMNWEKFNRVADHWIPKPTILHPNPNVRFDARYPR